MYCIMQASSPSLHNTYRHYDRSKSGIYLLLGSDYKEGDIRLVGGNYNWVGRVETYLEGEWENVTGNVQSAHVVCQQLGYDTRCEYHYASLNVLFCSIYDKYKNHFMK